LWRVHFCLACVFQIWDNAPKYGNGFLGKSYRRLDNDSLGFTSVYG
jgi:hypothetical protein